MGPHQTLIKYFSLHLIIVPIICSAYDHSTGVDNVGLQSSSSHLNDLEEHRDDTGGSSSAAAAAKAKFFGLFTLFYFSNTMCTVGSLMGFCVTARECTNVYGGTSIGSCARGIGTCCYKALKCGETSTMNVTYIQNPDYPGTTSGTLTCEHKIWQMDNVCNLRLDFVDFELTDPFKANGNTQSGYCQDDQMTATTVGVNNNQFEYLCGKMPPTWHFYLDVRDAQQPVTFTFDLKNDNTKARKWNIKVTQIWCDSVIKIPQGCGQYFTGTTGDPLYSFNFDNNGIYLHGMNYGICFRQEKGYCTHTFVDNGPSWVACGDQLAFPNADIAPVDLEDCNSVGSLIIQITSGGGSSPWLSPMTTNSFSPTIIYHWTVDDNTQRYLAINIPAIPTPPIPGFYFSWQANKC